MQKIPLIFLFTILIYSISFNVKAGWFDIFKSAIDEATTEDNQAVARAALSNTEIVSGLKEALAKGVEKAINTLGKPGGFLGNQLVKITVPESLKTVSATARNIGQGQIVDVFETTLNQAAEKATPEAATILAEAIRQMSVDDAITILNGPNDAATQYFRKVSEKSLVEKLKPIVAQATDQAGVTAAYKNLTGQAAPFLSDFLGNEALDLDQYVTNKSLDGLFKYIALEEKRIRENPAARATDLLKKVFKN